MAQVLIRKVDKQLINNFKTKAELNGNSLEHELREALKAAAPLTPDQKVALSRKMRATMPPLKDFDVRAAIRHGRDDEFDE